MVKQKQACIEAEQKYLVPSALLLLRPIWLAGSTLEQLQQLNWHHCTRPKLKHTT